MTNDAFLHKLEESDLVAAIVVTSLRKQIAAAKEPIATAAIAKLLVEKGHLTAGQAQRLLAADQAASGVKQAVPLAAKAVSKSASSPPKQSTLPAHGSSALDELGLAPLDDLTPAAETKTVADASSIIHKKPVPSPTKAATPSTPAVAPVALDDLGLAPLDDISPAPTPTAKPPTSSKPAALVTAKANGTGIASKPAAKADLVKPAAVAGLDVLTPLDDLGGSGLAPLEGLAPLDGLDPLGTSDLGSGEFGSTTALDPFASTADLGAISNQPTRTTPAAATSSADADRRTTLIVGIGVGVVALIVLVVGLTIFLWPRGDGLAEFQLAEQAYQEKQYTAAVERYDQVLRAFPRHSQASLMRVRRGLANIHAANSSPIDWPRLLPVIQREVPPLAAEDDIAQIHQELAPILLTMTDELVGLAQKASGAEQTEARLRDARAALELCNDARLVPANLRPWQKLADCDEQLQRLEYDQVRSVAVAKAKEAMVTKLARGDIAAALRERSELLNQHAELATSELWTELASKLTAAAMMAAKTSPMEQVALIEPAPSPVLTSTPWQVLGGQAASSPSPAKVILVQAASSVYGLDATSGQVAWSRYLGAPTTASPLIASNDQVAWLLDFASPAVIQVNARSGKFNWRQPLPARPTGLIEHANALLVATQTGSVLRFDAATGAALARADLPQSLLHAPLLIDDSRCVQLASEGLAYVLSPTTLACDRVIFVGHDLGEMVSQLKCSSGDTDCLLVAAGLPDGRTRFIRHSLSTAQAEPDRQTMDFFVAGAPVAIGKQIVCPTDRGSIVVLESSADPDQLFKVASTVPAPPQLRGVRNLHAHRDGVHATDQAVTRLTFDSKSGLSSNWSALSNHTFDAAAVQATEQLTVVVYYAPATQSWLTSALAAENGQVQWTTTLTQPLKLVHPRRQGERPAAVALGDHSTPASRLKLPAPLEGTPALSGNTLLAPLAGGTLVSLHVETGEATAQPYLLPDRASQRASSPVVFAFGSEGKEAIVVTGNRTVTRLGLVAASPAHWNELASASWVEPLTAPPVVTTSTIFGVTRGGKVAAFTLPDLNPSPTTDLGASVVTFGPHSVGDSVLLTAHTGELHCFEVTGERRWRQPLVHGSLAGSPVARDQILVLVSKDGEIESRTLATGEIVASIDVGQPLLGTSLLLDHKLWVPTMSGQVLQVDLKSESSQQ